MSACRHMLLVVLLFCAVNFCAQDTIRYRSTSFHGCVSDYLLISPQHPQCEGIFPAAILSLKSSRTDSNYNAFRKLNFTLLMGIAASRYLFFDEKYFVNIVDKSPYHILSKHFWGGFGLNYRTPLSSRWVYDVDVMPCIQINVDRSEDSKTDTSGWVSLDFYNIYQGLLLNVHNKFEYKMRGNFSPFVSCSFSVPLTHYIARDRADEPYYNTFKAQIFFGLGVSYYYRSRRIADPSERKSVKP